jgi:hypothetical protein
MSHFSSRFLYDPDGLSKTAQTIYSPSPVDYWENLFSNIHQIGDFPSQKWDSYASRAHNLPHIMVKIADFLRKI